MLTERNLWVHFIVALLVLALSVFLKLSALELTVIVLTITVVIAAEMFNTAIEVAVDLIEPANNPLAALAKNVAAGAVLTAAFGAVVIGLLIFLPKFVR